MFRINMFYLMVALAIPTVTGCNPFLNAPLVGEPGNPRFNLYFTNEDGVDLDLHVIDPGGTELFYANSSSASGGNLDNDCECATCPLGPSENIYWPDGAAPEGVYTYWVEYYGSCSGGSSSSSQFYVRVLQNDDVVAERSGTLSSEGSSPEWTFTL